MKSIEKFSYDVSALATGFEKANTPLISTLIASSQLMEDFTIMPNVKGQEPIKIMSSIATLQPKSCTFNPNGSIVLSDIKMVTSDFEHQFLLCNQDLKDTWGKVYLAAGASAENLDMNNELVVRSLEEKVKDVKNAVEKLMILGDTGSGNSQLAFFDGLVKTLDNVAGIQTATFPQIGGVSQDPTDPTQALDIVEKVANTIPTAVIDAGLTPMIYVSSVVYNAIKRNIKGLSNFGAVIEEENAGKSNASFVLPISGIRVKSNRFLAGTNTKIYGVVKELMFFGTDLESDFDAMMVEAQNVPPAIKGVIQMTGGVQVGLPENFVKSVFL